MQNNQELCRELFEAKYQPTKPYNAYLNARWESWQACWNLLTPHFDIVSGKCHFYKGDTVVDTYISNEGFTFRVERSKPCIRTEDLLNMKGGE